MGQVSTDQCAQSPAMLAADRGIINVSITAKSKQSPTTLSLWFERNIPIVKLSAKDATAPIIKARKKITRASSSGRGHAVCLGNHTPTRKTWRSLSQSKPRIAHSLELSAAPSRVVAKIAVCPFHQLKMGSKQWHRLEWDSHFFFVRNELLQFCKRVLIPSWTQSPGVDAKPELKPITTTHVQLNSH